MAIWVTVPWRWLFFIYVNGCGTLNGQTRVCTMLSSQGVDCCEHQVLLCLSRMYYPNPTLSACPSNEATSASSPSSQQVLESLPKQIFHPPNHSQFKFEVCLDWNAITLWKVSPSSAVLFKLLECKSRAELQGASMCKRPASEWSHKKQGQCWKKDLRPTEIISAQNPSCAWSNSIRELFNNVYPCILFFSQLEEFLILTTKKSFD